MLSLLQPLHRQHKRQRKALHYSLYPTPSSRIIYRRKSPLPSPQLHTDPLQMTLHRLGIVQIRGGDLDYVDAFLFQPLPDHAVHLVPVFVSVYAFGQAVQVDGELHSTHWIFVEEVGDGGSEGLTQLNATL